MPYGLGNKPYWVPINLPTTRDMPLSRLRALVAVFALTALVLPATASASHEQGGFLTTKVTKDNRLQGTLTYLTVGSCTVGTATGALAVTITHPLGTTAVVSTKPGKYTRCIPNSRTITAEIDVDLATAFNGVVPDGAYLTTFSTCCRVGGIVNVSTTDTTFRSQARKTPGGGSSSPVLASSVATGVAKGYDYAQDLNASDPDGGSVAYSSRAAQGDGPAYDVISFNQSGRVAIPASVTSTWLNNKFYIYKIRVTDDQGDFAERDVLLRVTANNAPPSIVGVDGSAPYQVAAGSTRVIAFTATDPNNATPNIDVVSVSGVGLPSWASLQVTPGNPAQGKLTLSPPAGTSPQELGFSLDATDDDATVPLTGAAAGRIQVVSPAPATPRIDGAPSPSASSAGFTFSGDANATFECAVDDAAYAACASPFVPTGLADGAHTFRVRAVAGGSPSDAATASWTQDTSAPAAPAVLSAARTDGGGARVEFAGEAGGSFECRIDGAAWSACASPHQVADVDRRPHTFTVRQTDAAGNVGVEGSAQLDNVSDGVVPTTVEPVISPNATVAVRGDTATVGCRVASGSLSSCYVDVFANPRARGGDGFGVAGESRLVLIGRGRVKAGDSPARRLAVDIELNAVGRRLMADSLAGVQVVLKIEARVTEGPMLRARKGAKLVPARQLVVPTNGLFASGSTRVLPAGKRALRSIARGVGRVKSVRCTGHTDAVGSARYNSTLGLKRAQAVCATLRKLGVRGKTRAATAGESRPRATNGTARGRALNRRVELLVTYR
jgi:outer membrane protein OmpA-like peptidoglycan-associated protein